MPRVKPLGTEQQNAEFRGLLAYHQSIANSNDQEAADMLGITVRTYREKKKHPEKFTLREIRSLAKHYRMTGDEIVRMVV